MEKHKNTLAIPVRSSEDWRQWLDENGNTTKSVFLILYKKSSGIPSITVDQAIDDALCYGWVDSKINKRDEQSWYQYFAQRNPKSNWSRVNKEKIERLTLDGKMRSRGLAMVELAKKDGTWTALDDVENLIVPNEMETLLHANLIAKHHWSAFSRSVKRGILEWIFNAKRPETREERIVKTVRMAALNLKANFDKE